MTLPYRIVPIGPGTTAAVDLDLEMGSGGGLLEALPVPPRAPPVPAAVEEEFSCPTCTFKVAVGVGGVPRVCEMCGTAVPWAGVPRNPGVPDTAVQVGSNAGRTVQTPSPPPGPPPANSGVGPNRPGGRPPGSSVLAANLNLKAPVPVEPKADSMSVVQNPLFRSGPRPVPVPPPGAPRAGPAPKPTPNRQAAAAAGPVSLELRSKHGCWSCWLALLGLAW